MIEQYKPENLPEYVRAIKNFSNNNEGFLPNKWFYLGAPSLNNLYTELSKEKYQSTLRIHIFNLILPSTAKFLIEGHINSFKDIWTAEEDWRLKHHLDLFNVTGSIKVFAVIYSIV